MKRTILILVGLVLCAGMTWGQSRNLKALLNYTMFNVPGKSPMIETYLSVDGNSAVYRLNNNGKFQAIIEVTFIFRQQDEIREFDKYQLFSPEIDDTTFIAFEFMDQQRYFIPEGDYEMEIQISDLYAGKKPFSAVQPIEIRFDPVKITFSGIQLVKTCTPSTEENILTKGGYDMVPMVSNFFPESLNRLIYYTEVYNSDKNLTPGEKFLVTTRVKSFETGNTLKEFVHYKKVDARPVVPILNEFDISRLPSGNYTLNIEVRNKLNEMVAYNEVFFQRSNPSIQYDLNDLASIDVTSNFAGAINSPDTLLEFIRSLDPIATDLEKTFIYKQAEDADQKTRQQFFYNFWLARNQADPEKEWRDYYGLVVIVNSVYKTQIHKGYESDRGRVYLKYGPPNIITESYNEPSTYPYEIWHYYELSDNQRNKKFVFYTHDLITNNFTLLHSDAIGEVSNYKWQIFLNNRWYDPFNVDAQRAPNIWGDKSEDYYRNPR